MPRSNRPQPKFGTRYFLMAMLIWLALVTAYAAWAFLIPHNFEFGGQIGPLGGFLAFVILYSVPYAIAALLIFFLISVSSAKPAPGDGA